MAIEVKYFSGPRIYGHVVRPEQAVRAGVLILPTIFGVNEFAKGYAQVLAEAGLAAAVWDINSGLPLVTDYRECIRRARTLTDDDVAQMVGTWMDVMTAELGLASIGLLGFCIGGRFALLSAAANKRVRACAVAYPSIEDPRLANQERDTLDLAPTIDCPVLVLQPGNDHVTGATTYERLNRSLFGRGAPTVLQYYPKAEHGFMHREQPDTNRMATHMASPQLVAFLTANLN